jgi:hypothetical protein
VAPPDRCQKAAAPFPLDGKDKIGEPRHWCLTYVEYYGAADNLLIRYDLDVPPVKAEMRGVDLSTGRVVSGIDVELIGFTFYNFVSVETGVAQMGAGMVNPSASCFNIVNH